MDAKGIAAADNLNIDVHPDWSQINVLDPQLTCSPSCNAKIPPWTGATSTADHPLITVSQGTWMSTITQPPLIITEWVFEAVILAQDSAAKRKRAAETLWSVPATTPS
ncbi:hypothetical protein GGI43DRAFT_379623 [Trichoderma evansii]